MMQDMAFTTSHLLLFTAVALSVIFMVAWWFSRRVGNYGWVDVVWSGSLALLAVFYGLFAPGSDVIRLVVGLLGGLWGLRLFWYLAVRVAGEEEDGRYQALRERWSQHAGLRFFGVFQIQALVAWAFGLVFLIAASNPQSSFGFAQLAGIGVWLLAVGGEALADYQLSQCKAADDSAVCEKGLWGWSRHPNYFFEWLHWFAYPLIAFPGPYWWLALLGPAVMLLFLYRLTGIPWSEKQSIRSRGDAYRDYQQRVSAFVPLPPGSRP